MDQVLVKRIDIAVLPQKKSDHFASLSALGVSIKLTEEWQSVTCLQGNKQLLFKHIFLIKKYSPFYSADGIDVYSTLDPAVQNEGSPP